MLDDRGPRSTWPDTVRTKPITQKHWRQIVTVFCSLPHAKCIVDYAVNSEHSHTQSHHSGDTHVRTAARLKSQEETHSKSHTRHISFIRIWLLWPIQCRRVVRHGTNCLPNSWKTNRIAMHARISSFKFQVFGCTTKNTGQVKYRRRFNQTAKLEFEIALAVKAICLRIC